MDDLPKIIRWINLEKRRDGRREGNQRIYGGYCYSSLWG